jgi:hypothetical protein
MKPGCMIKYEDEKLNIDDLGKILVLSKTLKGFERKHCLKLMVGTDLKMINDINISQGPSCKSVISFLSGRNSFVKTS